MTDEALETPPPGYAIPASAGKPLRTLKHERFANLIVRGKSVSDAYVAAGYKKNAGNAKRLFSQQDVRDRVEWLMIEAAKLTVYDAAFIKDRLAQHAVNLTETEIDEETGRKKAGPLFNASAGVRALELLGKEHGLFKEKIELGGKVQVANRELFEKMTPEERATFRAMLVTAASRLPRPANENAEAEDEAGVVPNSA